MQANRIEARWKEYFWTMLETIWMLWQFMCCNDGNYAHMALSFFFVSFSCFMLIKYQARIFCEPCLSLFISWESFWIKKVSSAVFVEFYRACISFRKSAVGLLKIKILNLDLWKRKQMKLSQPHLQHPSRVLRMRKF